MVTWWADSWGYADPHMWGSMGAADYEREALKALGLAHPAEVDLMKFHEIGDTELFDCPEACRAIAEKRLAWVRREVLPHSRHLSPTVRAAAEALNFMTFGEYLAACDRVQTIKERERHRDNLERKKRHDQHHAPDKPKFYADYETATPLEIAFARGFNPDRYTKDLVGYLAYIASVSAPLQKFFYRRLPVWIPDEARKRHSYIVGKSGSGKSELLKALFHGDLRKSDPVSLVVIEPHGDMTEELAKHPSVARSGRLIFINPTLAKGYTPTINPFELADQSEDAIHNTAGHITNIFNILMSRSGFASLTGNMTTLLVPCISVLLRRPGSTIEDLQAFMDDKRNGELVSLGENSPLIPHRNFFKHMFHGKDFDSTKSALAKRIQSLLNVPHLYRFLVGKSTIDLDEAVNSGKIVIFSLQKGTLDEDTVSTFGIFVLGMLQGIAFRRQKIPVHLRMPTYVYVDEFQNFLSASIKKIMTELRKYGLHLTLAQQSFAQDMDIDIAAAVIGNTAVKFCGMSDVKTLKPMNERLGVGIPALKSLKQGRFFVSVDEQTAVKVAIPLHPERITAEEWEAVKADQLGRYYRTHAKAATVQNVTTDRQATNAESVEAIETEAERIEEAHDKPPPKPQKKPPTPPEHLKLV